LNIPSFFSSAKTFCSIQPCVRFAEGDLIIERDGKEDTVPVCPRHHEYVVDHLAKFGNADILNQEIVFVQDVGMEMANSVAKSGLPHIIIK
jgi:hypothetical protein